MRFYDFNTRVHLIVDPGQYGRIGVGMFGGNLDASGTCQFVFWEHPDAGEIVSQVPIDDLVADEEEQPA